MATVGSLVVDLIAQTASFNSNIEKAAANLNTQSARMNRSLDSVKKNIGAMRAEAEGLALGLFIREAAQFVKRNLDMAGSLGETAQQLGVTTRQLQVYRAIGGQVGVTQAEMDAGLQKLTMSIGKASVGSKAQGEAFLALGIKIRDSSGHVKGTGTVLEEIADRLSKIQDPAQRAAVEVAIFGRAGQKLDTILTGGKAGIEQYAKRAEEMGMILSDKVIDQADAAADKIDELNTQLKTNIAREVAENSGAILGLASALVTLTTSAVGFISKHPQLTGALAGAAAGARLGWPGAAAGAVGGLLLGRAGSQAQDDANMDVAFRSRALQEATARANRFIAERDAGTPAQRAEAVNSYDYKAAKAELARQQGLLARAMRPVAPAIPVVGTGAQLENFLASGRDGAAKGKGDSASLGNTVALIKQLFPNAQITSTFRPGDDGDHGARRAIDFVVPGLMNAAGTAFVKKRLEDSGLTIRRNGNGTEQFFGPGRHAAKPGDHDDHFHVGFSGSASPEEAARLAERAADEARRNQEQFQSTLASLNGDLLDAKRDNVTDAAQLAQLSREQVTAEAERLKKSIEADAATNPIIAAKQDELKAIVDQVAAQKLLTIDTQEAQRKSAEALQVRIAANDNEITLLELQDGLATTAQEHRDIQLRILDLEKERERLALEDVLASAQATEAQKKIARARLGQLDHEYGLKTQTIKDRTAGPGEQYLKGLITTAGEVNEAFEQIEVKGLQSLEDGLVDAIMGAKSLGDVFKGVANQIIADLLRIAVQKMIVAPLANALFGGASGGGGGGGFLGSLFGSLLGFADGTNNAPAGYAWVGEEGPEIVKFRGGEKVIPNHALNDNGGMRLSVEASPYFDVRVDGRIVNAAPGIAQAGSDTAQSRLAHRQSRSLVA